MKLPTRDLLELAGLVLIAVIVWGATHLWWATCIPAALSLLYLSHAWVWEDVEIPVKEKRRSRLKAPEPIVSNRRLW